MTPITVGLLLAAVAFSAEAVMPSLSISPADNIKEGMDIIITCTVAMKSRLDVFKIKRGDDDELSVKNILSDLYKENPRYTVESWNRNIGEVKIRISRVTPADSGIVRCIHMQNMETAEETIKIMAAPKTVEIQRRDEMDVVTTMRDDDVVVLREDIATTLICRVYTDSIDFDPVVTITFGNKDVTQRFAERVVEMSAVSQAGYMRHNYTIVYELASDRLLPADNRKQMTCQAALADFTPARTYVNIESLYSPVVNCKPKERYAKLGSEYELSCTVSANPSPDFSFWVWTLNGNETNIQLNQEKGVFLAEKTSIGGDKEKYTLYMRNVTQNAFHEYELEVSNRIGTGKKTMRLQKEKNVPYVVPSNAETTTKRSKVDTGVRPSQTKSDASPALCAGTVVSLVVLLVANVVASL